MVLPVFIYPSATRQNQFQNYFSTSFVSFVRLTHFETDDKNRHLIADRICCALRVHSLARVVFHRLTKATWSLHSVRAPLDEAAVCSCACLKMNGAPSHVIWPVAFAALNHQLLSETL